jgi:hypothetical protein
LNLGWNPCAIEHCLFYVRMYSENSSVGAGTQLASPSSPGELCWNYKVNDPSALYLSDLFFLPGAAIRTLTQALARTNQALTPRLALRLRGYIGSPPAYCASPRTRARALGALLALGARPEVDQARIAAIGSCFPMSLELARSGAEIKAVVGFHTSLTTQAPAVVPGAIKARVLVCIGADDPFIPATQRAEFESEMRNTGTDWQINVYGRTVHSFTNAGSLNRGRSWVIASCKSSMTRPSPCRSQATAT